MVDICRMSQMSRTTFYDLFDGISDCLTYAFGDAYDRLIAPTKKAREDGAPWLEELTRSVGAFYLAAAENPLLAELCLVHSAGAVEEARGHDFEAAVGAIAEVIGDGRETGHDGHTEAEHSFRQIDPKDILARGIVATAALRVRQGKAALLPEHRDEMVMLVVSTLFGTDAMATAQQQLASGRFY